MVSTINKVKKTFITIEFKEYLGEESQSFFHNKIEELFTSFEVDCDITIYREE